MIHSLRARMASGFTLAFAFFVALVVFAFVTDLRHDARVLALTMARDAADKTAEDWDEDGNLSAAFAELREQTRFASVSVRVVDQHGRTIGASRRDAPPFPETAEDDWITASDAHGADTVIAGVDRRPILAEVRHEAILLILLALPVVGVASLLAWALVGRTLRPIADLAEQAAAANDALHVRLAEPSADAEVRRLVATLNDLLDRLRRSAEAREQFYVAAAHELRTPLAVLAGSIELALSRPRSSEEQVETLRELQRETRRLIGLSEGLLTLNRLQTQSATREPSEPVDVAEQCAHALAIGAPSIRARRLRVDTAWTDDPLETMAPPAHVTMIVRNLIENAVKYTTEGGHLGVAVTRVGDAIAVRVANDCPAASDLPLDRLYEPFYRAEASRSPTTGGNGLGLAICRQIADAHGWRLTLTADDPGVLTATVLFPAV